MIRNTREAWELGGRLGAMPGAREAATAHVKMLGRRFVLWALSYLLPLALGCAVGLLAMNLFGVTVFAQGVKIHPDSGLSCIWNQPANDLTAAQAIKIRATLDTAAPLDMAQVCSGSASPFTCSFPLTSTMQAIGPHTLRVEGANVDPVDGSLSAYVNIVTVGYEIVPPVQPPAPGSNGRIGKIAGAIGAAIVALFFLFGHH
jgi:hypothetical protein